MPAAPESGARAGWWQCVALGPDGRRLWLAVVGSNAHPAGARVELPAAQAEQEAGAAAACTARYDEDGRVVALTLGDSASPGPSVWFAEVRETTNQPPAVNLIAFGAPGPAAGDLVDEAALADLPVRSADQFGAVRWYPGTGEVDQIYVQPDRRRRRLGSALIAAAAALSYARDWPRLWGDGQRTAVGERFRNGSPWRDRAADLTHVAPPMTPGES